MGQANALEVRTVGRFMHVLMETSAGNITIELFHGSAPDTVANFVKLVEDGFYDGLHFHRYRGFHDSRWLPTLQGPNVSTGWNWWTRMEDSL